MLEQICLFRNTYSKRDLTLNSSKKPNKISKNEYFNNVSTPITTIYVFLKNVVFQKLFNETGKKFQ